MATVDEDDLLKLGGAGGPSSSSTTSPWIRLDLPAPSPSTFYLKLLHLTSSPSSSSSETRLVAILTDLKTGLYSETFESARSIQVRLRVSNNSSSSSSSSAGSSEGAAALLERLDQEEAVETLFTQIKEWYSHVGPKASLEARNDDEMELLIHLESLAFRFRMDKISSPSLQIRILHDLLLQPALALIQTLMTMAPRGLQATQEAIDNTASKEHQPDPVLLSAIERYAQAAARRSQSDRIEIKPLPRRQPTGKNRKSTASEQGTGTTPLPIEKMEIDDPDATIDSVRGSASPRPSNAGKSKGKGKQREASASPSPPPPSSEDKVVRERYNDTGDDSDATQASENDSPDEDEVHISHSSKRSRKAIARSPSPEPPPSSYKKRKSSVSPPPAAIAGNASPSRKIAKKGEEEEGEKIPKAPAPSVPVLARAGATAARGRGRGRGTAAGQWTRFG